MHPRLSSDGTPVGQRKKSKNFRDDTKAKNIPAAVPLHECTCFDCVQYPDLNPHTQLPGRGRWLSQKDLEKHRAIERKKGVATMQFGVTSTPALQMPVPEFGFLPAQSTPSTSLNDPGPSNQTHRHSPPPQESSAANSVADEAQMLFNQLRSAESVLEDQIIVFQNHPSMSMEDPDAIDDEDLQNLCELDHSIPTNSTIIGFQQYIGEIRKWLKSHPLTREAQASTRLRITLLERKVNREDLQLGHLLREEWKHQAMVSHLHYSYNSTTHYISSFKYLPPLALASYLLAATLYLLCGLSMDHSSFVLGALRCIVSIALESATELTSATIKNAIYQDIRTVINILEVDPPSKSYVSCPKCCFLYWINPDNPNSYPNHCTNQETDQPICGAKLKRIRKKRGGTTQLPVREYRHQSMQDFVAHLYSRHDLQDYLYSSPITHRGSETHDNWDIWDAPGLREFLGPDNRTPFVECINEGRLVFSLNMDGFNPFGNKESGKKVSIGAMYMVCLNLPPSIRYNIENIYLVGVIPGPNEPSLHQINYYLRPLVDELMALWSPGMYLTRTLRCLRGLLVRCALVPLVCDLPAARQMAGFAHYSSHHFCSFCTQTLDDINNIDYQSWIARDQTGHRTAADGWRDAQTQKEREEWMDRFGVRWSELLRLPYWDPTKYTIIDSMHGFYLRLFQHHCRKIWGMNVKVDDGDARASHFATQNQPDEEAMREANEVLRYGTKTNLQRLPAAVLRQLCKDTSTLSWHLKKPDLLQSLLDYRIRQGWFTPDGRPLGAAPAQNPPPLVPQVPPLDPRCPILQNPEIQSYIQDGVVPRNLQIKTLADVDDYYKNADNSAMTKLTKPDLLTLFTHRVFPTLAMPVEQVKRLLVADLHQLIQKQRQTDGLLDESGRPISRPRPRKKTHVLGRNVLAEVRQDMRSLRFPSWVTKPPSHPGEEKWGKFSADQWRTFCLHVLPVTLIRLWGGEEEGSIQRRQLDNFLHLVSAVKLATMRKMTEERITRYEFHMHAYLKSLVELYPGNKLTPYQHLSLHYGPFLRRFGPGQAWRCFAFERYNYVMQNLPTNGLFGELESTLFKKFCHAQRLRTMFTSDSLPTILHPFIGIFNKAFNSDNRGTRLNDNLASYGIQNNPDVASSQDSDPSTLPSNLLTLLRTWISQNDELMDDTPVSRVAVHHEEVNRWGVKFAVEDQSVDNSHVIFDSLSDTFWRAGSIKHLFTHSRLRSDGSKVTQTFVVISPYQPLQRQDRHLDHFQRYPVVGGKLYYNTVSNTLEIVSLARVRSHFAAYIFKSPTPSSREWILAQPLDKD